jgi:hypothetical protein
MKHHSGVLCKVIGGTDGLNLGKIVKIASLQGEHSQLGRIWRCAVVNGQLITEYGAVGITADFAQDWLEPIPPLTEPEKTLEMQA